MFSRVLVKTFANGYLMLSVCARTENDAWRAFESKVRTGRVPFYPIKVDAAKRQDAGLDG